MHTLTCLLHFTFTLNIALIDRFEHEAQHVDLDDPPYVPDENDNEEDYEHEDVNDTVPSAEEDEGHTHNAESENDTLNDKEPDQSTQDNITNPPASPHATHQSNTKNGKQARKGPRVSRSQRSGLVFPVGRVESMLRSGPHSEPNMRISGDAPVELAAVLEYLISEVSLISSFTCYRLLPRSLSLSLSPLSPPQSLRFPE